jgi:hypothetical protein
MKKSVLSIIFLVAVIIAYSQNYNPFLQNIGWCLEEYIGTGSIMSAYTNNGDTTIGSLSYTKLFKGNTLFLVREDIGLRKAWVILPNSSAETLLYDFGISIGAQINLNYFGNNPVSYTVDAFDSIDTPLGFRKRIKLLTTDTVFNPNLYWIEGIGSSYSPVYLYDPTYAPGPMSEGHCLICAYIAIGVQSFSGTCGIPCIGYSGSPCYSFIVGINDLKNDNLEITIEKVTNDLIRIRLNKDKIKSLKIFSMEGKQLKSAQNINKDELLFSTNNWTNGLYIIEVISENGIKITGKLSK